MKDPVALAYSGRVAEARAAALDGLRSGDPFHEAQALEALAALGEQLGVRADAVVEERVAAFADAPGAVGRRAWEAATALGIGALEGRAERLLATGEAGWVVVRYAGEQPSRALGEALEAGFGKLDESVRDEALLALAAQPVPDAATLARRAALSVAAAAARSPALRLAAANALPVLAPEVCAEWLPKLAEDDDDSVRSAARAAQRRHAEATLCWARWTAWASKEGAAAATKPATPARARSKR